jgi:hypothetical protein
LADEFDFYQVASGGGGQETLDVAGGVAQRGDNG